jgi:serine phosphatase RsbU (regulator of sigma subunit)
VSGFELIVTIFSFALGATLLFLAATALRDNFSNKLNRISAVVFFFAGLAPIFDALGSAIKRFPNATNPFDESIFYDLYPAWEFVFPALIVFALVFTSYSARRSRRRLIFTLILAPQLLHLFAMLVFRNADSLIAYLVVDSPSGAFDSFMSDVFVQLQFLVLQINTWIGEQDKIFPPLNALYGIAAVSILANYAMRARNLLFRKQAIIITAGVALPTLMYIAVFVSSALFDFGLESTTRALALTASISIFVAAFFWAIIRYQFLNIGLAVRQSVVYTVSTGALAGVYLLGISAAQDKIDSLTGGEGVALTIGFAVLALIFFQPLNSQIEDIVRRIFLRDKSDFRNLIERFSRQTISVFEPTALRAIIEETLKEHLMVRSVYFALYQDTVKEYAILAGGGFEKRHIIDRSDVLLGAIGQLEIPTPLNDISHVAESSRLLEETRKRNCVLILPLRDADRLLGFIVLSEKVSGAKYTSEDQNLLRVLSNQLVSALTNARLYAETVEKKRLEEEVAMARQIQIGLLPRTLPSSERFSLAAHSVPSRTVGGDFYDVIPLGENKYGIVIADASGKGMPAAMVITQIQAMLRSELSNRNDICEALANVNNHLVTLTSAEKFVTLCFGIFDSSQGLFEYANAGHNYPVLIRSDGSSERLDVGGMLIGAFADAKYESATIRMYPEDFIFFFTDGISETMNGDEEEYGEDRLVAFLQDLRSVHPEEIISSALEDLHTFQPEELPQDDRTIVVLKAGIS